MNNEYDEIKNLLKKSKLLKEQSIGPINLAKDIESDGIHTHLLKASYVPANQCPGQKEVIQSHGHDIFISYNSPQSLGNEGDVVRIMMDAECAAGFGIDEGMSDKLNLWISYRSWICDAIELKVLRGK
jgi:hypothetical protein